MTCLLESLSLEVSLSHVGVHSTLRFIAVTFAFSFAFTLLEELALSLLAIVVLLNLATLIVMSTQDLDLLVKRKEKSSRLVSHTGNVDKTSDIYVLLLLLMLMLNSGHFSGMEVRRKAITCLRMRL
jgi:4-hydroxybenzoate polyprenyltransferase